MKEIKVGDRFIVSYTYLINLLLKAFQKDRVFLCGNNELLQLIAENEIGRAIKDGDIENMENPMTMPVHTLHIERNVTFEHNTILTEKLIKKYQNDEKYKDVVLKLNNILDYMKRKMKI